ncbi:hypothetical protein JZ751_023271 [Albula glossodonta]|uniref:Uncharacterized protein n=1 Tax=Albula glossodonta TaxID=121402 RepID=A0A8T2PIK6_9TELE|nr:hypothetical protein JZ751_023271 [Albula glossodonta]
MKALGLANAQFVCPPAVPGPGSDKWAVTHAAHPLNLAVVMAGGGIYRSSPTPHPPPYTHTSPKSIESNHDPVSHAVSPHLPQWFVYQATESGAGYIACSFKNVVAWFLIGCWNLCVPVGWVAVGVGGDGEVGGESVVTLCEYWKPSSRVYLARSVLLWKAQAFDWLVKSCRTVSPLCKADH